MRSPCSECSMHSSDSSAERAASSGPAMNAFEPPSWIDSGLVAIRSAGAPPTDAVHREPVAVADRGDGQLSPDRQALVPAGRQALDERLRRPAGERSGDPHARLVAGRVAMPDDPLAVRRDLARDEPDRLAGDLPALAGRPVPRVQLVDAALRGGVDQAVGSVAGPRGESRRSARGSGPATVVRDRARREDSGDPASRSVEAALAPGERTCVDPRYRWRRWAASAELADGRSRPGSAVSGSGASRCSVSPRRTRARRCASSSGSAIRPSGSPRASAARRSSRTPRSSWRGSERAIVAPGIASIYARDPMAMANGAKALAEAYPGRFVLGIGVSHAPSVAMRGGSYGKPIETMTEYLDGMAARRVRRRPSRASPCRSSSRRSARGCWSSRRRARTARIRTSCRSSTRRSRGRRSGRSRASRSSRRRSCRPTRTRPAGSGGRSRSHYLALPNYANNLRRLGWSDEDIANDGSDRLIDAVIAWGDVDAIVGRVKAHLDGGADHVCVQLRAESSADPALAGYAELASALLAL